MRTVTQCAALVVAGLFLARASADDRKPVVTDKIPTDQEFLAKALEGSVLEVQLGEKARDKTSNDRVKKFAQRMIADHTKARRELPAIAKATKAGAVSGISKTH